MSVIRKQVKNCKAVAAKIENRNEVGYDSSNDYVEKIDSNESKDRAGNLMAIQIGIIMDPIESINFKKDTTLAILLAAQIRDCEIFYMLQTDLYAVQGVPWASMRPLSVYDNEN